MSEKKLSMRGLITDCIGNSINDSFFKRSRDNTLRSGDVYITCECFGCIDLHIVSDDFYFVLKGSFKDSWKDQDIIELVWIVTSSCSNYFCSCFVCILWHDFWIWICHSKDQRVSVHTTNHFFGERSTNRDSDKNISSFHCLSKSSSDTFFTQRVEDTSGIGDVGKHFFDRIESVSSFKNGSNGIYHHDVFDSVEKEEFCDCNSCGSDSIDDDFYFFL